MDAFCSKAAGQQRFGQQARAAAHVQVEGVGLLANSCAFQAPTAVSAAVAEAYGRARKKQQRVEGRAVGDRTAGSANERRSS